MKRLVCQTMAALGQNSYYQGFVDQTIYQGSLKSINAPTLNCYACPAAYFACPIGTLQHFIIVGQAVPFYVVGYLVGIGAIVGRMACGWLCPIGFGQDLLYKVRSVKLSIPRGLVYSKYVILAGVVLIITYVFQEPWFSKLCPAGLLLGGVPWSVMDANIRDMLRQMFWIKMGILSLFVTWATAAKRPFCRTTCPLGTVYSYFNAFSFYQMRVDQDCCTRCNRCRDVCPMDIAIYENTRSGECIRCLECTACPCVEHRTLLADVEPALRPADLAEAETY